jgi:uncharacterized protein YndB with AHSA1/START domain
MRRTLLLIAALGLAAPASSAVRSASPQGFALESKVVVAATPEASYAMLAKPADWWNPQHSYSGDSANLQLDARAGGCFCERLPKTAGGVEHMRVVLAWPVRLLRLQGGLGPLQAEGVTGSLTWTLKAVPGGTEITQTYIVGGYVGGGAEKLAPLVDQVMAEQLGRLQARLAR